MLILISSYIPNILAMLGGDGKIIEESLSMGILVVDVISYSLKGLVLGLLISYSLKGLVLGLLMKNYDVKNPDEIEHITNTRFIICSIIYGVLFAALNYLTDIAAGAVNSSWRLCSILGVSTERETLFYIVFTIFMFMAGILLPLWNRCCLPKKASISASIIFALEISLFGTVTVSQRRPQYPLP